jgi:hypothetical protein
MQDHTFDELREALGAQQGEGFEEKLKNLLNQKSDDPDWADEMKMREEYRQKLEPKYVIVKHRGSYCFRADYTDYHRSLLDKDEIYNHLCDGGGFWGVDGENHRVTLYDSSSDFGRPKHIEEAIRNDGERLLKILGEVGDKEGNKYDLTGYDITYIDAIGHRHVVKPWTAEERQEHEERMKRELADSARPISSYGKFGATYNHKHYNYQEPKNAAKKKKNKRRQQKQARRKN